MRQYVYHYHAVVIKSKKVQIFSDGIITTNKEVRTDNDYHEIKGEIWAYIGFKKRDKLTIKSLTKLAEYDIDMEIER